MKVIIDRIHKWNSDRRISEFSQKQNIVANLLEELTELHRARCTDAKIDALCDICVFAWGVAPYNEDYENLDDVATSNFRDIPCFVGEYDKSDDSKWLVLAIKASIQEVYALGYDFKIAMDETLKEIESRTGLYSVEKGKFAKDEGAYSRKEAMAKVGDFKEFREEKNAWYFDNRKIVKWYKANYSLADKGGRDAN